MKKGILLLISLFAIMLAVSACNSNQTGNVVADSGNNGDNNAKAKATIFKSESCGCCGLYASYIDQKGFDVEVVQIEDIDSIKEKYKIPAKMQSCHTTIIGDYFVEGHMPGSHTKAAGRKAGYCGNCTTWNAFREPWHAWGKTRLICYL